MKRRFRITTALALTIIFSVLWCAYGCRSSVPEASFRSFRIDKPRSIEFQIDEDSFSSFTRREKLDQIRDWLLFTIMSDTTLTAVNINQISYDLPAIRQGYLRPGVNLEYGDTRSCNIGDGKVIALLPTCNEDERFGYMGRIADEHRKNSGKIPISISEFEYKIDFDNQSATVTRHDPVGGEDLFTDDYGYHEIKIRQLSDFESFMKRVDTVTYASLSNDFLTLGGRKVRGEKYRGIRAEDVAALWQSEKKIKNSFKDVEAAIKSKEEEFNARLNRQTFRTDQEAEKAVEQTELEFNQWLKEYRKHNENLVLGSGFSLDPHYNFDGLARYFAEKIEPLLRRRLQTAPSLISNKDILDVEEGFKDKNADPLFTAIGKLLATEAADTPQEDRAQKIEDEIVSSFGFQKARYDGELRGTEVGMVLFYTDLLAKLWGWDFANSSPRSIAGFRPKTETRIPQKYRKEMETLSQTRIWFGPEDYSFQPVDNGNGLLLGRKATRLYSASSSPYEPGNEKESNYIAGKYIKWWDDHYEEIARYEPEYERLNEIMKWSLVIGWLNNAGNEDRMGFLQDYSVNKENKFPEWARSNTQLKFQAWDQIDFPPQNGDSADGETLPILYSKEFSPYRNNEVLFFYGGVSLAEKRSFAKRPALTAESSVNESVRRPSLDYGAIRPGEDTLRTIDGATIRLDNSNAEAPSVILSAKSGARLRDGTSEYTGALKIERDLLGGSQNYEINTRVNTINAGSLKISKTQNGFKIGYLSRDIDEGHSLARRLSRSNSPETMLAGNPNVEAVFKIGESSYLAKTRGSSRWIKLMLEDQPAPVTPDRWAVRVSSFDTSARNVSIEWLEGSAAKTLMPDSGYIHIRSPGGSESGVMIDVAQVAPSAASRPLEIRNGSSTIVGQYDPVNRTASFRWQDLPSDVKNDPAALGKMLRRFELSELQKQAETSAGMITHSRAIDADLSEELFRNNNFISERQYVKAIKQLDNLVEAYGEKPEFMLRRGIAQLFRGKLEDAKNIFESLRKGNPQGFYDEFNARISQMRLRHKGERISFFRNEKGKLEMRCDGVDLSRGSQVGRDEIERASALVYVQDDPSLNAKHWDVSIRKSLIEVISGEIGEVIAIPASDIRHFNPTIIYDAGKQRRFNFVGMNNTDSSESSGGGWPPVVGRPPITIKIFGLCDDDEEDDEDKDDDGDCVYFVIAK
jgi:hypothetical protein